MASGGGRGRREGSRDGGGSGPIYRLEGSRAKRMALGRGRSGLGRLDGEVAEGAVARHMAGRRSTLPDGQGRMASGGAAS
jgi:hypothetical protein